MTKELVNKDSAEFHKELLDNEDEIIDGIKKIIANRDKKKE